MSPTHPEFENDHNVYILGAGFSREAGLPLISDFLQRMREALDWVRSAKRTREVAAIGEVLSFRLESAAAALRTTLNVENVEELFSLAAADNTTSRAQDMTLAIAATLDHCRDIGRRSPAMLSEPCLTVPNGTNPLRRITAWKADKSGGGQGFAPGTDVFTQPVHDWYVAAMLGLLGQPRPETRSTFITFNYDLVLENALESCGRSANYAVARDKLVTTTQWIRSPETADDSTVEVLKLHGSLNWSVCGERHDTVTAAEAYARFLVDGRNPFIVPPTWRKDLSGPLTAVWDAALRALSTATRVIVVGFSMPTTDLHFRYMIAAGLNRNISLRKFIVVDPAAETTVKARALEILRPELIQQGILEFVPATARGVMLDQSFLAHIGRPRDIPGFKDPD